MEIIVRVLSANEHLRERCPLSWRQRRELSSCSNGRVHRQYEALLRNSMSPAIENIAGNISNKSSRRLCFVHAPSKSNTRNLEKCLHADGHSPAGCTGVRKTGIIIFFHRGFVKISYFLRLMMRFAFRWKCHKTIYHNSTHWHFNSRRLVGSRLRWWCHYCCPGR